jgi:hypothetical protein
VSNLKLRLVHPFVHDPEYRGRLEVRGSTPFVWRKIEDRTASLLRHGVILIIFMRAY